MQQKGHLAAWGCLEGFQERLAETLAGGGRGQNGPGKGIVFPESRPKTGSLAASPSRRPSDAQLGVPSAVSASEALASCWPTVLYRHLLLGPLSCLFPPVWLLRPAQNGRGSPTTAHPASVTPGPLKGWRWWSPRPPALVPAACQPIMHLALKSSGLQPLPPAQHPEGKVHPVHPVAWPLGNVSGLPDQPGGGEDMLGFQSSQARISLTQPEPSPLLL